MTDDVLLRAWAADQGACGYYRMIWPWEALAEVDGVRAEWSMEWTGNDLIEADVAVVQRACLPTPVRLLELVVKNGGEYWYEVDDDLLNLDPTNVLFSDFQAEWRRAGVMHAMNMAKGLLVSTEPLGEAMQEYNPNYRVVPNTLPDYFGEPHFADDGFKAMPRGVVKVLWAGSPTHHGDIHEKVRYGVRKAVGRAKNATLFVQGHDYRKDFGQRDGIYVPWKGSIPDFHRSLTGYDIGLCPLQRTTFNRSKSGLKAMEYQAAGIVPIAEDSESYRGVVEDGVDGFLVRTEFEWKDRLEQLIHDDELRATMRAAGRAKTAGRLVSANTSNWLSALDVQVI